VSRVAVVTGGSRGIGLAVARALAGAGHHVVIASRTEAQVGAAVAALGAEFPGVRVLGKPTDVSREEACAALVAYAVRELGGLDVVVNNAGVNGAIGLLETCDLAEWRAAIEVNLYGTVYMTRAAVAPMRARGGGSIVNFAGGGVGGAGVAPRVSAYTTSKGAIVQFTESIARELAADGIRVNAISPGAVVTEMTAAVVAAGPEHAGVELWERTKKQRDSGGESPDRAAALVAWLASPESAGVTGRMLSAKWDDVAVVRERALRDASIYTLRRIDDALFASKPK
jgi:NAD(P)-dependent dehydrogenase (short-subunit alcohol dehydrogenase family)